MRAVQRRYLREILPATATYVAVLLLSLHLLRDAGSAWPAAARAALALAPMLPVAFMARAIVRAIRDSDEFQRKLSLEAAAVAGLAVGLGYFSLALLGKAGLLQLDAVALAVWVFPSLCAAFGIAKLWLSRGEGCA